MENKKFVMSFSAGKDSTLALFKMIQDGYKPIALLTTVQKEKSISWSHGLDYKFLERISESLEIPLLKAECESHNYAKVFEETLLIAKKMGANICVFGDIDIKDHKKWGIDRCKNTNMEAKFPLWECSREKLVYEFIDTGFKTVINKVNLNNLDKEFLGKILTKEVVYDMKKIGIDPCGENGEYHTFVFDGPIFKNKIDFDIENIIIENGYAHLKLK